MKHINSFAVDSFRGIQKLKLADLGQINLLIGENNSGKTSVLEALSIYSDPFNWRKWREVASAREVSNGTSLANDLQRLGLVDRLTWLFPQQQNRQAERFPAGVGIQITATGPNPLEKISATYKIFLAMELPRFRVPRRADVEVEVANIQIDVSAFSLPVQQGLFDNIYENREGTLLFSENRPRFLHTEKSKTSVLPAQLINPFSHRLANLQPQLWTKVVEANLKDSTLELLRLYDSGIQDVDLIFPDERRLVLSVKHQDLGRAPLSTFGDGLRRIFTLAVAIPSCQGGFLLIDELETAIHTKALRKTFEWLVNACMQNDVQLFATTHSLEAVDAVLDACKNDAA